MAKVMAMLANATTGFTAVGVLRSYKEKTNADVKYARDANGEPDKSAAVKLPTTASAELELDGAAPVAGTTEITVGTLVLHTTSCETVYSGEKDAATVAWEGSEKKN